MLTIEKPRKRQEGVQGLQYHKILESSFVYYIVGKPGSGKTHLVSQLLGREDIYLNKFSVVILISPQKTINCTHYIQQLEMKEIWNVFKDINLQESRNILIVFDDVISQIQHLKNDVNFQNLIFNRRNILQNNTISIIFTSQKYVLLPPNIRSCVSMLFFFQMFGNDMLRIRNEWIKTSQDKQKLDEAISSQKEYDFVSIRAQPYQIRLSFNLMENMSEIQNSIQNTEKHVKYQQSEKTEKVKQQPIIFKTEKNKDTFSAKNIINYFKPNTEEELKPAAAAPKKLLFTEQNSVTKTLTPKYQNSLYNLL